MTQTYDVNRFLREVQSLLWQAGLDPQRSSGQPKPEVAASMLLRAYGITPVMDQIEALARNMNTPWPDQE